MSLPCKINPLGYTPPLPALFLESVGTGHLSNQYIDPQVSLAGADWEITQRRTELTAGGWFWSGVLWGERGSYVAGLASVDSPAYAARLAGGLYGVSLTGSKNSALAQFTSGVSRERGVAYLNELEQAITSDAPDAPFYLFCINTNGAVQQGCAGAVYKFDCAGTTPRKLRPAISPTGEPCMFDHVTKRPFYNKGTGAFIVGMTAAQARALGKLPADATTKTLTVSLPASIVDGDTVTDTAVQAALNTAAAHGWTITIQTYTE